MTVSSEVSRSGPYNGNGATTVFAYSFKIFAAADLLVTEVDLDGVETPLVLDTDYTVDGVLAAGGGNVTLTTALTGDGTDAGSHKLTIRRVLDATQPMDLRSQGKISAEVLERAVDRAVMLIQQLQDENARSLRLTESEAGSTLLTVLPSLADRKGRQLTFDPLTGQPTASSPASAAVSAAMESVVSSATLDLAAAAFTYSAVGATAQRGLRARASDFVNVKDFGALGNGVADDTAAIQAAVTYAISHLKKVYIPANDVSQYYKITAPIACTGPVSIVGDGANYVTIIAVGLTAGQFMLDFNLAAGSNYFVELSGFTLRANGTPNGIRLKNVSYVLVKNVQTYSVLDGITITGTVCFSHAYEQVHGYNTGGKFINFNDFTGGGHFKFDACTLSGSQGLVFDSTSAANQMSFISCNFEQCSSASVDIAGTIQGLSFIGCRTEGADVAEFLINPTAGNEVTGLTVCGCYFTTDAGAITPIRIGGAGGKVRGFSICGNHVEYAASSEFVLLNGEGESGVISGNYFNLNTTVPVNVKRHGVVVFANENALGKCAESWGSADWGVEQGTWTPVDASGAGLTFGSASGEYTKIGRVVHWRAYVLYPATANEADAAIGGLPFPAGGSIIDRAGVSVLASAAVVLSGLHALPTASDVSLRNAATMAGVTNATLSGKDMYMSGQYKV